jgi:hypothetical protein
MKAVRWPRGLAVNCAVLIWAVWLALHALGWRESVSVLSGTLPDGWSSKTAMPCALGYLFAYFGAVLLAPALLLSALFCRLLDRLKA